MTKVNFVREGMCQDVPSGIDFQRMQVLFPHLPLKFGCRRGECGVCLLKVKAGGENLTKVTHEEKKFLARKNLASDYRLGCQCAVNGDISVDTCRPSQTSETSSVNCPEI